MLTASDMHVLKISLFFVIVVIVVVDAQNTVKQISTYSGRTCVIMQANSKIKCFGYGVEGPPLGIFKDNSTEYDSNETWGDEPGEMGNNLPFVNVGNDRTAKSIHLGEMMNCALLDDDTIKCWGDGASGSLGRGNQDIIGDEINEMGNNLPAIDFGFDSSVIPISFCTGNEHVCTLFNNSEIKCFGGNSYGQLGLGDTSNRGDEPNEMGSFLPLVNLGSGITPKKITCGSGHVCALFDNSKIKCWGANYRGQLGLGDTDQRGDNSNEMADFLSFVDLGASAIVIEVSGGYSHTCAILDGNGVKCWGSAFNGAIGSGDKYNLGDGSNEMGDFLPILDFGADLHVLSIATGNEKTCVILNTYALKCFGENESGALGLENPTNFGDHPNEMGDFLPIVNLGTGFTAKSASIGPNICAILNNDKIKCWGDNTDGILGYGDTISRGSDVGTMGDNLPFVLLFGSSAPTSSPIPLPTKSPTLAPTRVPTIDPTSTPSASPTIVPTYVPSINPTSNPTQRPTISPTRNPTHVPTANPTRSPTKAPQIVPTKSPSKVPSHLPSAAPTETCGYKSAKPCKYDSKCMWFGVGKGRYCRILDCTLLSKNKCMKQKKSCKWEKATKVCNSKK